MAAASSPEREEIVAVNRNTLTVGVEQGRVVHAESAFRLGIDLDSTPGFSKIEGTFSVYMRHETNHAEVVKRRGMEGKDGIHR